MHAARARGLSALGMKPVAAGADVVGGERLNEDVAALRAASSFDPGLQLINPWCLASPIAPHIAAAEEGVRITPAPILDALATLRQRADVVLVEGQGSINHPGYSGVTVGLLHGSCPDAMILCHQASRQYIGDYRQASWLRLPPLSEYVKAYEALAGMVSPSKVIGIALNTYDLSEDEAREACRKATEETGLPATDPVRFDPAPLIDAIAAAHQTHTRTTK